MYEDKTLFAACVHSGTLSKWTVAHRASLSMGFPRQKFWCRLSVVAQIVKSLPAMQETPVRFLGQEDPLEIR